MDFQKSGPLLFGVADCCSLRLVRYVAAWSYKDMVQHILPPPAEPASQPALKVIYLTMWLWHHYVTQPVAITMHLQLTMLDILTTNFLQDNFSYYIRMANYDSENKLYSQLLL